MPKSTVSVNPEILVWARETAGLGHGDAVSTSNAARILGVNPTKVHNLLNPSAPPAP